MDRYTNTTTLVRRVGLGLATAAILTTTASGQARSRDPERLMVRSVTMARPAASELARGSTLTAGAAERLAARIDEAATAAEAGRYADAERILGAVVDEVRDAGGYPRVALRRLAEAQFALDRPATAARTLEALADAAHEVSDPATEFDALLDASVLHQMTGNTERHAALAPRIRTLLRSPAVPEASRARVPVPE